MAGSYTTLDFFMFKRTDKRIRFIVFLRAGADGYSWDSNTSFLFKAQLRYADGGDDALGYTPTTYLYPSKMTNRPVYIKQELAAGEYGVILDTDYYADFYDSISKTMLNTPAMDSAGAYYRIYTIGAKENGPIYSGYNITPSVFSVPTMTTGLSPNVKITNNHSVYYPNFRFGFELIVGSEVIDLGTTASQASGVTSTTFTLSDPPNDIVAADIPDADSKRYTVRMTAYRPSGSQNMPVYQVTGLSTITLSAIVRPTITSVIPSDTEGYRATYGVYVGTKSTLQSSVEASGIYGSTITKVVYQIDGLSVSTTDPSATTLIGRLNQSGSRTLKTTVTDSRGRTGVENIPIPVMSYVPPSVSLIANRWDTIDSEASDGSDTVRLDIGGNIPSINIHPVEGTLTVQGRQKDAPQWTVISTISVSGTIEETVYAYNQSVDSNWDYRVILTDSFGTTVESADSVGTATPILEFHSSGKGMGIGTIAPEVGLDVGMQADFKGTAEDGFSRICIVNPEGTETIALAKLTGSNLQLLAPSSPVNDYDRAFVNSHVFMQNNLALGWLTSGDAQTTVLRMNASNQVELNWSSGGLRGRVGKLLWSGSLSEGGSLTDSELPYYQVFAFLFSASNGTYVVTSCKVDQTIYAGSASYAGSVWMLLCGINITGTKLTLHHAKAIPLNSPTTQTGKSVLTRVYGLL